MKRKRSRKGSTIAETGPALYMFIFIIFFPLLDLLGYTLQYGCAWYYNHMMIEELSVRTKVEGLTGTVKTEVDKKFMALGIPKFLRVTSLVDPAPPVYDATQNPQLVTCTTVLKGEPFIPMPIFGLSQTSFQISSEAIRENQN